MSESINVKERIVKILMFIILCFLIIRYCLFIELTDIDQLKILMGVSVCFMFVDTQYPHVVKKKS